MITQSSIERVLSTANIVDVIGSYVTLKRSGNNWKACCPFHNEATASFMVSDRKQIFKCFGCGEGGNVLGFLIKKAGLSFPEAVSELARRYGIPLEFEKDDDGNSRDLQFHKREPLMQVNGLAARYFATQLQKDPEPLGYTRGRISDDDIATWHVGWAPEGWDNLLNHLRDIGVQEEVFLASGLIAESEKTGNLYDFFRGRIIFPIHDISGRVVAFGGRAMPGSKEVKYINSGETALYNKSSLLYGLHLSYNAIRKQNLCNLVEGYTDVIAMHRAGLTNTVAACGTSVTEQQLLIISRYTKNINLVADGDGAGLRSMKRAGAMALKLGFTIFNTLLPEGRDPYDVVIEYE